MSARVQMSPTFSVLKLDRLFSVSGFVGDGRVAMYGVTADAQRFLMLDVAGAGTDPSTGQIVLVQNFAAELARRSSNGGER